MIAFLALMLFSRSGESKARAFVFTFLIAVSIRIWFVFEGLVTDIFLLEALNRGGQEALLETISSSKAAIAGITRKHALLPVLLFSAASFVAIFLPRIWPTVTYGIALLLGIFFVTGNFHAWLTKVGFLFPMMGEAAFK